ncbi:unnamed protein product, partial [Prorocentrum cordatum]
GGAVGGAPHAARAADGRGGDSEGNEVAAAIVARIRRARDALELTGEITPFGSHVNGLRTATSDCDLAYSLEEGGAKPIVVLQRFASELPKHGFTGIITVFQASVPLVKAIDESGVEVDLCIGNQLGIRNSKLVGAYCGLDPRVAEVGRSVKQWAKSMELVGSSDGHLNSYAFTLMTLFYLMKRRPPVLPNLQEPEPKWALKRGADEQGSQERKKLPTQIGGSGTKQQLLERMIKVLAALALTQEAELREQIAAVYHTFLIPAASPIASAMKRAGQEYHAHAKQLKANGGQDGGCGGHDILGPPFLHVFKALVKAAHETADLNQTHCETIEAFWTNQVLKEDLHSLAEQIRLGRIKAAVCSAIKTGNGVKKIGPPPRGPLARDASKLLEELNNLSCDAWSFKAPGRFGEREGTGYGGEWAGVEGSKARGLCRQAHAWAIHAPWRLQASAMQQRVNMNGCHLDADKTSRMIALASAGSCEAARGIGRPGRVRARRLQEARVPGPATGLDGALRAEPKDRVRGASEGPECAGKVENGNAHMGPPRAHSRAAFFDELAHLIYHLRAATRVAITNSGGDAIAGAPPRTALGRRPRNYLRDRIANVRTCSYWKWRLWHPAPVDQDWGERFVTSASRDLGGHQDLCERYEIRDRRYYEHKCSRADRWGREIPWDCRFWEEISLIPKSQNTETVDELLQGFFEYYSSGAFDWREHAVSVRLAMTDMDPALKSRLYSPSQPEQWYIEDPFDLRHNLASQCSRGGRARIMDKIGETLRSMSTGANPRAGFEVREAFLAFNSENDRRWVTWRDEVGHHSGLFGPSRRVHKLNETYVGEWQLRFLLCSSKEGPEPRVRDEPPEDAQKVETYEERKVEPRATHRLDEAEKTAEDAGEEVRRGLRVAQNRTDGVGRPDRARSGTRRGLGGSSAWARSCCWPSGGARRKTAARLPGRSRRRLASPRRLGWVPTWS